MKPASPEAYFAESYCQLLGLFALEPSAQRALLPARVEPVYVSFNEGDGYYTQPLSIVFHTLRDVALHIAWHYDEAEFRFVPQQENEALLETLAAIYNAEWKIEDCFETSNLEETHWAQVGYAARLVWEQLDASRQLPFGDWREFIG